MTMPTPHFISSVTLTPWRVVGVLGLMLGLQIVFEQVIIQPAVQTQPAQSPRPMPQRHKVAEQLDQLQERLPLQQETNQRIHQLHQLADQNRVEIRKASYSAPAAQAKTASLPRHEITMELAGAYPDVRQFLRDLQAQDQALALDSLEFSRPNNQSTTAAGGVRTRLQASLYYRPAAP